MKKWNIKTGEIKSFLKDSFSYFYANKFENVDEMEKILDK